MRAGPDPNMTLVSQLLQVGRIAMRDATFKTTVANECTGPSFGLNPEWLPRITCGSLGLKSRVRS